MLVLVVEAGGAMELLKPATKAQSFASCLVEEAGGAIELLKHAIWIVIRLAGAG